MEEAIGEELVKEFLGDMPAVRFIANFVLAFLGMFLLFATDVQKAIKYDKSTPSTWSWKAFFSKGALRLVINTIFIAVSVIIYEDIAGLIMGIESPPAITLFAAFLMGTQADLYVTKLLGLRRNGA
jgi:hypothetical protein